MIPDTLIMHWNSLFMFRRCKKSLTYRGPCNKLQQSSEEKE